MSRSAATAFWSASFGGTSLRSVATITNMRDIAKWLDSAQKLSRNPTQNSKIIKQLQTTSGTFERNEYSLLGQPVVTTNHIEALAVAYSDVIGPQVKTGDDLVIAGGALLRICNNMGLGTVSTVTAAYDPGYMFFCSGNIEGLEFSIDDVFFGSSLPSLLTYGRLRPEDIFRLAQERKITPVQLITEPDAAKQLGLDKNPVTFRDLQDMVRFEYTKVVARDKGVSRRKTFERYPELFAFQDEKGADKMRLKQIFTNVELKAMARQIRSDAIDEAFAKLKLPDRVSVGGQSKGDCAESVLFAVSQKNYQTLQRLGGVTLRYTGLVNIKEAEPSSEDLLRRASIGPCGNCSHIINEGDGNIQLWYDGKSDPKKWLDMFVRNSK